MQSCCKPVSDRSDPRASRATVRRAAASRGAHLERKSRTSLEARAGASCEALHRRARASNPRSRSADSTPLKSAFAARVIVIFARVVVKIYYMGVIHCTSSRVRVCV